MANMGSILVVLLLAVLLVVVTLLSVPLWRSERKTRGLYGFLLAYEIAWLMILDQLLAVIGVPHAWQNGVEGVLFWALMAPTFVLLVRHRHDADPDEA